MFVTNTVRVQRFKYFTYLYWVYVTRKSITVLSSKISECYKTHVNRPLFFNVLNDGGCLFKNTVIAEIITKYYTLKNKDDVKTNNHPDWIIPLSHLLEYRPPPPTNHL